jgi:hypothetical protein
MLNSRGMSGAPPQPLRPHTLRARAPIRDAIPLPGGGIALLTASGVDVLDDALGPAGSIAGEGFRGHSLTALAGGRFLVYEPPFGDVHAGAPGGELAKVDLGKAYATGVVATSAGFVALTSDDRVLVDVHGERRWLDLPGCTDLGLVRFREGALVAGREGLVVLDAHGEVRERGPLPAGGRPIGARLVALPASIALPTEEGIALLDGASERARIPVNARSEALRPFGTGVLVDEDRAIELWAIVEGAAERAWRWSGPADLGYPKIAGARIVMGALHVGMAWILDASGELVAEVPLPARLVEACAFDDGVAMRTADDPAVVWWRPGRGIALLEHDVEADLLRPATPGLISAEADVLYRWRTDVQGPELPAVETGGVPLDTPIVVGGTLLTVRARGRFTLRAATARRTLVGVAPGSRFRPAVTRAEALALMEALVARRFDGPLPDTAVEGMWAEVTARLAQLPLAETLALHGRALFAPVTLDEGLRRASRWAREEWFAEVGQALGLSGRQVSAAVRAGQLPLDPPRPVPGFEYLGAFTTTGKLTVSDPCYVGKKSKVLPLSMEVEALPGRWHVFVRPGVLDEANRTAELVVIHPEGFDVVAADPLGSIGVDSGQAGVFDRDCPKRDGDEPFEEGVVGRLGAVASSGLGDGFYPVFGGSSKGRLAKIRLHFLGPSPAALDATVAMEAKGPPRRYAPSERFAVGDAVEHAKFGAGTVVRVRDDGKIEVAFADAPRVLVHKR